MPQMNPVKSACYTSDELTRYLREQLEEGDELAIQNHIDACPDCQHHLERLAASRAMWDALQDSAPESTTEDSQLSGLSEYLSPAEDPRYIGRLGFYEIAGIIGQGSTGIVLKAFDSRLNRYVAIKVLSPNLAANGPARRRFEREGRAIAAVSHEHVVPIYAVDEYRGLPYIVMQYIPGCSLLGRIEKSGALTTCEVVRIGLQVASGLAAAHQQGIIHRDVKPANVLLEETVERAMVTDFGLARVGDEATMTRSGTISGTPQYMSPEQAKGESVDARTDLFSLGSLLYAACTARAPFRAETVFGIIHRVCETDPRPIREINPDIDAWLVDFISKLMHKDVEQRFDSAEQVAGFLSLELAHLQNPTTTSQPPRPWASPAPQLASASKQGSSGRSRWAPIAVALAACLAVGGYFAWQQFVGPDREQGPLPQRLAGPGDSDSKNSENDSDNSYPRPDLPHDGSNRAGANTQPIPEAKRVPLSFVATHPDEGTTEVWTEQEDAGDAFTKRFVRRMTHGFRIPEDGTLELLVEQGDIEIRQTELDYATFLVLQTIEAGSREEAEKIASYHEIELPTGDQTSIQAQLNEKFLERGGEQRFENFRFGLAIPVGAKVEVETKDGNVWVQSLVGDVSAESNAEIRFEQIQGDLWARSRGGEIVATQGCSGSVDFMATHGNVSVAGVEESARLRCSDGNIYVGSNPGNVSAHATGGDVRVAAFDGPVGAHVEEGEIYLQLVESPVADSYMSVSSGSIHVVATPETSANLMARGNILSDLDWTVDEREVTLHEETEEESEEPRTVSVQWQSSQLGEGGKSIQLVAFTGDIEIELDPNAEQPSLGGSGNHYFSLGGSGNHGQRTRASQQAIEKTSGEPRPGAMVPIEVKNGGNIDGYTLYLPVSYNSSEEEYPVLVYLQGGYGVGGPITQLNDWGLPRLIRDEEDTSSRRNQLLLDSFIIVSIHIQNGDYSDRPDVIQEILGDLQQTYRVDDKRIYVTGLSRGGHASYDLPVLLPETFAAAVPIGGRPDAEDLSPLKDISVWIAHNQGDPTVEWTAADQAVASIEDASGVSFLRTEQPLPSPQELEESKLIFTEPLLDRHDAWTELYCSTEFYEWLLRQSR